MNYVYILLCADGTFYTGWTNNLQKRVEAHNLSKGAKYTKGRLPVKLIYFEEFQNKSDALKREAFIKKLSREDKQKLIKENSHA
jgi:putative endonuclease